MFHINADKFQHNSRSVYIPGDGLVASCGITSPGAGRLTPGPADRQTDFIHRQQRELHSVKSKLDYTLDPDLHTQSIQANEGKHF